MSFPFALLRTIMRCVARLTYLTSNEDDQPSKDRAKVEALIRPMRALGALASCTYAASVNRPGMSGDSASWEGWSRVRWFVEEVSAGVA